MASDFVFPSNVQLRQIAQEFLPRLQEGRLGLDIMPITTADSHIVEWEQEGNYIGLQQIRGMDGDPQRVKHTGGNRYLMTPGYYGEFERLDEMQLTARRPYGTFGPAVDVSDMVARIQRKLMQRELDRIESIIWTLAATGTYSVSKGSIVLQTDSYTLQTYSAGVTWATSATATPLADLRAVQLKSRGYSLDFGGRAKVYMNRSTFNSLISNTNNADLYGRRTTGLGTINSPEQVNQLLAQDDLPDIVVYDRGYYDDTSTFQLFIPNNKAIVVGVRDDNEPLGNYVMTRNANNPGLAPGRYVKIIDRGETDVPRSIEVHEGHNGAPAVMHPAGFVVMSV